MKVEILLVEKKYDLTKESNYFERSKLDSDQVWQGEITNVFIVFLFFFKIARISNLNEFAFERTNLCVHVGYKC
jgi:hypothetical protein